MKKIPEISPEDMKILLQAYDKDNDQQLSKEEIQQMVKDFKHSKGKISPEVKRVLMKFDANGDGVIDDNEISALHDALIHSPLRLAGYTGPVARLIRYLTSSEFGGAVMKPAVRTGIVSVSYVITFGYCLTDIGMEAYDLHHRGYKTKDHKQSLTMTQCIVERTVFQGLASIGIPLAIIRSAVSFGKIVFPKIGRFQRFGPSLLGLSVLPMLPLCLDEPIRAGIEHAFDNYGPWANTNKDESHE
jgi:mitochondrial fission process protein 1